MTLSHDQEFVRLVRQHLEPVLLAAGFVLNGVDVGAGPAAAPLVRASGWGPLSRLLLRRRGDEAPAYARTTTSLLYEADAQDFAAAYPGSTERPGKPDCKDLWLHYDAATGSMDVDLQGEDLRIEDSTTGVDGASLSLEERVVAVTGAVRQFLAEASTTP